MVNKDITEEFQYDISYSAGTSNFDLTDVSYDVSLANIPFILKVDNQNPYTRQTAQYKKDQFDNSNEPGEQSLTGWWVRSQTSWHNGAGISFYEPGTDAEHVTHRFADSRGIDVWTIGEASLLNDTFESYTGSNGIVSSVAGINGTEYIVTGDSRGYLKRITLNGDSAGSVNAYTPDSGHLSAATGTVNPFKSVTTDGTRYFAVCDKAIHSGYVNNLTSDITMYRHDSPGVHVIKFTKGYLMFGEARVLTYLPITVTDTGHDTSGSTIPATGKTHASVDFVWNAIEGGDKVIYASGYSGNDSEIWSIPFEGATELLPYPAAAVQVAQLPYGEIVKSMYFYLGYLAIGTNKGIRIAQVNTDGSLILGPLLVETKDPVTGDYYDVTGFVANDKYIWASTSVKEGSVTNACLIRVDLSSQFNDGSFAYAYDLQYLSDESSYGRNVHYANKRLHIVVDEGATAGEIQTEKLSAKRASGWLQTGKIRYGTVEPKFFKYLQTRGIASTGDSIFVQTIDSNGNEYDILPLDSVSLGENIGLGQPIGGQEFISIKYTFNNGSPIASSPTLQSYQLKAIPGVPRQRLYQFPLSCYDIEMDKYNSQFGYKGRAHDIIQTLEELEVKGDFVSIKDYRTNEAFQGVIEEVVFTSESSPDKDSNGFGGLLLVTVRKL